MSIAVFSPAKVNLFLAITGRRPDGFHDLVSVAAPLDFGDDLEVAETKDAGPHRFRLETDSTEIPHDAANLVLRAAEAYAAATGWMGGALFRLVKRIPVGAGLGGGSSNAVAALRGLNRLAGGAATEATLRQIAAGLGSDCPLFLAGGPVVMRGRGERIKPLPAAATARLRGRKLVLLKPPFGIDTAWAYRRMADRSGSEAAVYLPAEEAERRLGAWIAGDGGVEELVCNNMEAVAFGKFIALPALRERVQRKLALPVQMSGSGSACFAFARDDQVTALENLVRECWGASALVQTARLA